MPALRSIRAYGRAPRPDVTPALWWMRAYPIITFPNEHGSRNTSRSSARRSAGTICPGDCFRR